MSLTYTTAVWNTRCVSGTNRFVLLCLAEHADEAGLCWPSYETIAYETTLSDRQVKRSIKNLKQLGVLVVEIRRLEEHKNLSNRYFIQLSALLRSDTESPRKASGSDSTSPHKALGSDTESPRKAENYPGSDSESLEVVTLSHLSGDSESPEPSINHQLKPSIKEEEVEEKFPAILEEQNSPPAPTATGYLSEIGAQQIWTQVTGMFAVPGGADQAERVIGIIQDVFRAQGDQTEAYLKRFWDASRTAKYAKHSLFWITEWAVSGEVPAWVENRGAPKPQLPARGSAPSKYNSFVAMPAEALAQARKEWEEAIQ